MVMPYPLHNYCVSPCGEPDVTRFAREQTSAVRIRQVEVILKILFTIIASITHPPPSSVFQLHGYLKVKKVHKVTKDRCMS